MTTSILVSGLPLLAACMAPAGPPSSAAADERKEVLAPIESAELLVRESFPPQYALDVVSGLPSGCARFGRIDVARDDPPIDVTVWNTVPAADDVVCTMIYGTARNTADLGNNFESGRTYRIRINGQETIAFTAQ